MEYQTPRTLVRWSVVHSILLMVTTVAAAAWNRPSIVALSGTGSLLSLTALYWKRWTPDGVFGQANVMTLIRLAGVGVLVTIAGYGPTVAIPPLGFLLLAGDGVDGWLARRQNQASVFGEYFDKETDAFLLLVVCLLLTTQGLVGPWILAGGLLRYLFVLTGRSIRGRRLAERKTSRGRIIYIVVTGLLLLCFLPLPSLHLPLALMALTLLIYSFAGEFWQIISTG
ncbi:MAG: CDP-alcohol phosphatidyltransferase family protein [Fidelibacterota bacterium]